MLLADNVGDTRWGKRREQEFTISESRSRLRFGVKEFYTQMHARSNRGLCLPTGVTMPKSVWFRHGHF